MHGDVTGSARRAPPCVLAAGTGDNGRLQVRHSNAQVSEWSFRGRLADVQRTFERTFDAAAAKLTTRFLEKLPSLLALVLGLLSLLALVSCILLSTYPHTHCFLLHICIYVS